MLCNRVGGLKVFRFDVDQCLRWAARGERVCVRNGLCIWWTFGLRLLTRRLSMAIEIRYLSLTVDSIVLSLVLWRRYQVDADVRELK